MKDLELFRVSLKLSEHTGIGVKVDFNSTLNQFLSKEELYTLITKNDEELLLVLANKISNALQSKLK